ncbi:MAG: hypothetical protein EXR96_05950 [Nitrospiraceae bacterium]|nr:hypothetical protein [Nitrospiraceae bacterium]
MKQLILTIFVVLALVVPASAQFSTFNGSDGTSGTIYNFGNGFQSYQDNKGNSGTIYNYGNGFQGYQFNGPAGPTSGSIYTYPTPTPMQPFNHNAAPPVLIPTVPPVQQAMPYSPYGRPNR